MNSAPDERQERHERQDRSAEMFMGLTPPPLRMKYVMSAATPISMAKA